MISNQLLKNYPVFSSANCPVRTLRLTVKCPYIQKLMAVGRKVRIRHVATNCSIAGGMTEFVPESDLSKKLIELLEISSLSDLGPVFKVLRIVIKNVTYFSEQYTRLSTRVGNILLADLDEPEMCIISVLYYLLHQDSNICFCVGTKMPIDDTDPLVHPVVNHIIKIEEREILDFQVFPVNRIKEKLMYLGGNENFGCVARLSSRHGQMS